MSARTLMRFQLLASIVRSDQLTHDQVQQLIDDEPVFAAWYRKR